MDAATVRQNLSIPYVLKLYGHHHQGNDSGRLRYRSPFRDDTHPSLDVWRDERGWRAGDFADPTITGTLGAIDVVERLEGLDNGLDFATGLYVQQLQSDWVDPVLEEITKRPFDAAGARARLQGGEAGAADTLRGVLGEMYLNGTHPGLPVGLTEQIVTTWRLSSSEDGDLLIPYYDHEDTLTGYKARKKDGSKRNAPGTTLGLYGLWRLPSWDGPVLIAEGETDSWAAQAALPNLLVLGLPGAGLAPQNLGAGTLAGRTVYLCLDGDRAGREATEAWLPFLQAVDCNVLIIPMADGADICSLTQARIALLPSQARAPMLPPERFAEIGGIYVRPGNEVNTALSNWSLELQAEVVSTDGDVGYKGLLRPTGKEVVLPAAACRSASSISDWSLRHGVAWVGSGQDHARLLQHLQHRALLLPRGRLTRRVGLHDHTFVWHDGWVGDEEWTWTPPVAEVDVASMLHIVDRPVDVYAVVKALSQMYSRKVMHPLLAWLAAAPIRTMFDQFPNVFVSGASGSGKTTLLETAVRAFSGSSLRSGLGSASPYGIEAMFSASNAFPLLIDEYRNGSKRETMERVDTLLRLAYTGMFDQKGGQQADKSKVTKILSDCPVIVSGEDSLVETSTTDRSILLRLRKQDKGDLSAIQSTDYEGFAYAYLSWLHAQMPFKVHVTPVHAEGLNDRQAYNVGVLNLGWLLLRDFLEECSGLTIRWPNPDFSMVMAESLEAASQDPTWSAVEWALEQELECVWQDEDFTYVQPSQLYIEITKSGNAFKIPGSNAVSVKRILLDSYDGVEMRKRKPYGSANPVHCVAIPKTAVIE